MLDSWSLLGYIMDRVKLILTESSVRDNAGTIVCRIAIRQYCMVCCGLAKSRRPGMKFETVHFLINIFLWAYLSHAKFLWIDVWICIYASMFIYLHEYFRNKTKCNEWYSALFVKVILRSKYWFVVSFLPWPPHYIF